MSKNDSFYVLLDTLFPNIPQKGKESEYHNHNAGFDLEDFINKNLGRRISDNKQSEPRDIFKLNKEDISKINNSSEKRIKQIEKHLSEKMKNFDVFSYDTIRVNENNGQYFYPLALPGYGKEELKVTQMADGILVEAPKPNESEWISEISSLHFIDYKHIPELANMMSDNSGNVYVTFKDGLLKISIELLPIASTPDTILNIL